MISSLKIFSSYAQIIKKKVATGKPAATFIMYILHFNSLLICYLYALTTNISKNGHFVLVTLLIFFRIFKTYFLRIHLDFLYLCNKNESIVRPTSNRMIMEDNDIQNKYICYAQYDWSNLAKKGLVVVCIEYRAGVLGFSAILHLLVVTHRK